MRVTAPAESADVEVELAQRAMRRVLAAREEREQHVDAARLLGSCRAAVTALRWKGIAARHGGAPRDVAGICEDLLHGFVRIVEAPAGFQQHVVGDLALIQQARGGPAMVEHRCQQVHRVECLVAPLSGLTCEATKGG